MLAATALNFLALFWLPLGEVAAITFTSPIIVAALAVPVLGERIGGARWLAILGGFAGAMLIIRPGAETMNTGDMARRRLRRLLRALPDQHPDRARDRAHGLPALWRAGRHGGAVRAGAVRLEHAHGLEWLQLAAIGVLGATGHLLLIHALRSAEASRVSPFIYLQLLWAMLSTLVVFGVAPRPGTLAGAAVVVASGLALYRLDVRERAAAAARQRS